MEIGTPDFVDYRLTRIMTEAATGYFDCTPTEPDDFEDGLAQSRGRPNDEFLRKHLLRSVAAWTPREMKARILATPHDDRFLRALLLDACLLAEPFAPLRRLFPAAERDRLAEASPLIFIKAHRLADHSLHRRWNERLRPNFFDHTPLPAMQEIGLPAPVAGPAIRKAMTVNHSLERLAAQLESRTGPPNAKTADPDALTDLALARLAKAGIQVDREMRHEASLSPIALLRNWHLAQTVACGRHRYRLTGEQIAYGRGLELSAARVACVMEIVERVSAYAGIAGNEVQGYLRPYPLVHARLSELNRQGRAALDPNRLGLEAPYRDEPLYWIEGRTAAGEGGIMLAPAQCIFLFCNLDEVKLFSGLGSNGLGAGAGLAEAKVKALLEVIERDSAAVVPHTPDLCFEVETGGARIARLLQHYADADIQVGFLDITGPLGLPCCKSFVVGADGRVAAGTGAHLDARRALISALTETPYPFPNGPASGPLPPAAVRVPLEALPNYDRGDPEENLALLEQLLLSNGFEPLYVDLTRADLGLPVVRAIVPGMEMLGDFDRFSRIHPRLYGHYLKYARERG